MSSRLVYGLFDGNGDCIDTCKADCESEAWSYFENDWDVNDESLSVDYFEPELDRDD